MPQIHMNLKGPRISSLEEEGQGGAVHHEAAEIKATPAQNGRQINGAEQNRAQKYSLMPVVDSASARGSRPFKGALARLA